MEVVTERFDMVHYVPVLLTNFENITINLANDLGDLVKFHAGKSTKSLFAKIATFAKPVLAAAAPHARKAFNAAEPHLREAHNSAAKDVTTRARDAIVQRLAPPQEEQDRHKRKAIRAPPLKRLLRRTRLYLKMAFLIEDFHIPVSSNGLLDLSSVTLELDLAIKVRSKGLDWTFVGPEDQVCPIDNILHSLFPFG
ncbi:hypothetical protein RvY_12329 [Ramazzottius varieornatus]|uniref:Uncharacterized protein n=1 Tax=Ramazzottius varieornatus TaxID=947166 RepID=A0A1D1VL52_RAMVA|nr:hypothetical protein RvY_12329 [Ramazzottius varieornatus]